MSRNQKKILQAVVTFVVVIIGILQAATHSAPESSKQQAATASIDNAQEIELRAVDGDTIQEISPITKEKTTIRLIGVDTPETVDPRKPVQCFGKEASDFTKSKIKNINKDDYHLEYDSSQGTHDKYGRTLAYLYIGTSTRSLNQEIIEEGYGHEYTYRTPYKYQALFKESERLAKHEKRGLWADGVCYND